MRNNKAKYNKYGNKRITIDGHNFPSTKEGNRYLTLKMLQKQRFIKDLVLQPKFELQPKFTYKGERHRAIHYMADFKYFSNALCEEIVEDVKSDNGFRTEIYKLKKKLFLYKYPDVNFIET